MANAPGRWFSTFDSYRALPLTDADTMATPLTIPKDYVEIKWGLCDLCMHNLYDEVREQMKKEFPDNPHVAKWGTGNEPSTRERSKALWKERETKCVSVEVDMEAALICQQHLRLLLEFIATSEVYEDPHVLGVGSQTIGRTGDSE